MSWKAGAVAETRGHLCLYCGLRFGSGGPPCPETDDGLHHAVTPDDRKRAEIARVNWAHQFTGGEVPRALGNSGDDQADRKAITEDTIDSARLRARRKARDRV